MHVRAGEEVQFSAGSNFPQDLGFSLDYTAPPPNDDWESRRLLSSASGEFYADPIHATGQFGPAGEVLYDRQLYWVWTAPFGGFLHIDPTDGTLNRNVGTSEVNGQGEPNRVVAGRTYSFFFNGREPRSYRFWLEPDEWRTNLSFDAALKKLSFRLEGPEQGIARLDASDDLQHWETLDFHATADGPFTLEYSAPDSQSRFYRLIPLW